MPQNKYVVLSVCVENLFCLIDLQKQNFLLYGKQIIWK